MDPDAIAVELFAEGKNDAGPIRQIMSRGEPLAGAKAAFTYTASVPTARPAADYTPRLVPQHEGALAPLEAPFILWHDAPSWR
jgi:starch phosphorylase